MVTSIYKSSILIFMLFVCALPLPAQASHGSTDNEILETEHTEAQKKDAVFTEAADARDADEEQAEQKVAVPYDLDKFSGGRCTYGGPNRWICRSGGVYDFFYTCNVLCR